ncbi:MAG: MFS transporter [Pseudomonadales bacterium]|jgi:predicted MFS family arabinose efflux permease|nr:MFS transporter [Pseudomonadales bacterium]MDP6469993.1 MFS transporter [Pseudomonadales bacterium]|tara:strand:- start:2898 stop:4073 length:1176 start_codon:yes stop_codon:yes gene_type:complete
MSTQIRLTALQLISLTGVMLLAFAASLGMAFNIDAIILSFDSTNTIAGLVASVELAAIAAGNLTFAKLATRISAQRTFLVGVVVIVSLNLASVMVPTTDWLIVCRAPAGFALGAVVATVMTTAGRSRNPEITFGIINSMIGVMGIFIAYALPRALHLHEVLPPITSFSAVDGLYLVYALCSFCALFFVMSTPRTEPVGDLGETGKKPNLLIGWIGLAGLGAIFFGHGTLGLFIVKVGRAVLLSAEEIGYVFMVGSVVGIILPLVAGFIGARMNAMAPIAIILVVIVISALALANAGSPIEFFVVAPVFLMLPIAILPIFLGCLARVDPTGSLAGAHAAFILIGGAVAPFAGGTLADMGGFTLNGWFVVVCVVVGAALGFPLVRRADLLRSN